MFTRHMKRALCITPLALAMLLAGCTSTDALLMERRVDYRSNSDNLSKNPLEVPPDLTALPNASPNAVGQGTVSAAATQSVKANVTGNTVLPDIKKAKLMSAGGQRWIVVQAPPEKVWPEVREFWMGNGFILTIDNPSIGILETDWLENRAKISQDWFSSMLRKVSSRFMSTGELDRYRTRIERGADGNTTEIYISHRGMKEVYRDTGTEQTNTSNSATDTIWVPRPSDPELEIQMTKLMLQRFGIEEETAKAIVQQQATPTAVNVKLLGSANGRSLEINDAFDRAWRRTGLALERLGYVVTDRDRNQGVYYVRKASTDIEMENDETWLSHLAFWRSSKKAPNGNDGPPDYEVRLKAEGDALTRANVVSKGKADNAAVQRLLEDLAKQLQ